MSAFRSTLIYLPGVFLPRVASLGMLVTMTHLVPKSEYGLLALVILVGELVDSSLTTWVRLALLRLGSGGRVTRGLAMAVLRAVGLTTALGGMLSLFVAWILVPDRAFEFWLAVFVYILSFSMLRFGLALLQIDGRSKTYSLLEIGRAISCFTTVISAAALTGDGFFFPSLALGFTSAFFALLAVRSGFVGLKHVEQKVDLRSLTAFAGPLSVLSILTIAAAAIDRVMLQYFWGAPAVGVYAAVYALARQPIDVLANSVNIGGYPRLVQAYESGGRAEASMILRDQFGFVLKFIVPPASVMYLIRNDIMAALLPPSYFNEAGHIFGLILLAAIFFNLRTVVSDNVFHLERRYWIQLCYFIFVFAIGGAVAVLCIPRLESMGAALAFLSWTTLALGLSFIIGRRVIAFVPSIIDLQRAVLLTIVTCAAVAILMDHLAGKHPLIKIAVEGAAATLVYCSVLCLLHLRDVKRMIDTRLRNVE